MNVVSTALLYEIIVAERLDIARVVVASSQSAMGEGLYRCPVDGEQMPGMRPESALAAGQWDIPCPECGGPLEMQATPERVSNPQNAYGMSKLGEEMVAINLGPPLRHPDRRAAVQHRPGSPAVGLQRLLRRLPHLLPELPAGQAADPVRGRRRHPRLRQHRRRGRRQRPRAAPTTAPPGGCSTSAAAGRSRPGSSPTSSCASTARTEPGVVTGEYRFGDTRHILSDISALRALGWEPSRTPADSVAAYAEWLKGIDGLDGVLAEANARMRALGVVRKAAGVKAFLLAAGVGSRLRPITDTVPKCMVTIDGQPLLDIWLDAFDRGGRRRGPGQPAPPAGRGAPPPRRADRAAGRAHGLRAGTARQRRHAGRQPGLGRRTRRCSWPATPTTSPISTCAR